MPISTDQLTPNLNIETILTGALKLPLVKIDRSKFLKKELGPRIDSDTVDLAIAHNPAYAKIAKEEIDKIAKSTIAYETNKASVLSFAAGLPGGWAMSATVPADITQYFAFILRVMQKLAYLYGFEQFDFSEENVSDETMNEILIFLGVMFGVQEANAGIKVLSELVAKKVSKSLVTKALTKGTVFPIVKRISGFVGINLTKQLFASGVSKMVPIVGGFATGALTYATFRPCAKRLKRSFEQLPLCDPATYNIIKDS